MSFSIRKLVEDEWQTFCELRLKALRTDPNVFGSSYETESTNTETEWRKSLSDPNTAIFALFDRDTPLGMSAVAIDRNDPTMRTAILWGSWLDPRVLNQSLSKLFYTARLAWVMEQPKIERVIVSHRESNVASKIANQRFGFVKTHTVEKVWKDGATENEHFYELQVNRETSKMLESFSG